MEIARKRPSISANYLLRLKRLLISVGWTLSVNSSRVWVGLSSISLVLDLWYDFCAINHFSIWFLKLECKKRCFSHAISLLLHRILKI